MHGKLIGWDDTIVAIATPPGVGAIGVVRLSGSQSFAIMDQLFPSRKISEQPSHTLHVGVLRDAGQLIDEVVVSLFRGPRSYTGEDVIEISSHGSSFIHQRIIEAVVQRGARLAKPGEFTQRAFLNAKLDLTQAEAVADLISSTSDASHKAALHTMRGGFSRMLKALREQLLSFSALMELELDFSQEDLEFADRKAFKQILSEAMIATNDLIESFKLGNVIRNGVQVAIIGKPNAGKSTLLNALLNEERAIVSEIAGTTRDTIEEVLNIDGILFRLIDTAGIRHHSNDVIESIGMERSLLKMKQADIIIYLFDCHDAINEVMEKADELKKTGKFFLLAANKIDLENGDPIEKFSGIGPLVFISASQKTNMEGLKKQLVEFILQDKIHTTDTVITNERHLQALQKVAHCLDDIKQGLDEGLSGDLITPDIRHCLHYLGEITGEITTEDQLDYIFNKFCIGK